VSRLERLLATIPEHAQRETYRRLVTLLTPAFRDGPDGLVLLKNDGRERRANQTVRELGDLTHQLEPDEIVVDAVVPWGSTNVTAA
jgi:hypothetical protein